MSEKLPYMVFSGTKSKYLAEKICAELGCPLGKLLFTKFADGEFAISYEESIRGRDIFLVQSTFPNSDNLMELLLMIDAAKRASARRPGTRLLQCSRRPPVRLDCNASIRGFAQTRQPMYRHA